MGPMDPWLQARADAEDPEIKRLQEIHSFSQVLTFLVNCQATNKDCRRLGPKKMEHSTASMVFVFEVDNAQIWAKKCATHTV